MQTIFNCIKYNKTMFNIYYTVGNWFYILLFIILSRITVDYIYPKCKHKFKVSIEAVLEFEQKDECNGSPISTPTYIICSKCKFDRCIPIDYIYFRGYYHKYSEK